MTDDNKTYRLVLTVKGSSEENMMPGLSAETVSRVIDQIESGKTWVYINGDQSASANVPNDLRCAFRSADVTAWAYGED